MNSSLKRFYPALALAFLFIQTVRSQESGLKYIDITDLKHYMAVLTSDAFGGRATGEPGLDSAAEFLAANARRIGLKAIDDNRDYLQEYTLVTREMDQENSHITISRGRKKGEYLDYPFYVFRPDSSHMDISGEVVFAGYGIRSAQDNYDDLDGVDLRDKLVLIMNRGPMNEAGDENLLSDRNWLYWNSFMHKIPELAGNMPKAILIVQDPKSGYQSLPQASPRMTRYLSLNRYVKELERGEHSGFNLPVSVFFIHSNVAGELLKSAGTTLALLQDSIDRHVRPVSFEIPGVRLNLDVAFRIKEKKVPNVAGLIEGSDPELKKEVIVYSAHYDHLGKNASGEIYHGADDNASGTAALLEIGQAFMAERENLRRSVLILWFSGEEIGLFGSEYYSENPLVPLENTVADLNLDMVGHVRTERDTGMMHGERISVLGMDSIGLIGGQQSSELKKIDNKITNEMGMHTDTSLNDPNHPYQYYYRSDQFNFARHNVPVLFYSTGVHVDYHKITDTYDRINFTKLRNVSELAYRVGYELATRPERIVVDNPYSIWGRMHR
jgi:hypothetical protein